MIAQALEADAPLALRPFVDLSQQPCKNGRCLHPDSLHSESLLGWCDEVPIRYRCSACVNEGGACQ
jgi:hypothetical protein